MDNLILLSGRVVNRMHSRILLLALIPLLLCLLAITSSWRASLAATPTLKTPPIPCELLTQEDAVALMGEPMALQENIGMGGLFFLCVYQTTSAVDSTSIMVVLSPALGEDVIKNLLQLAPTGEKEYEAAIAAMQAEDWQALADHLEALVELIPDAQHAVGETNESYTIFISREANNKKNVTWLAFGKELPLSFQVMAVASFEQSDEAMQAVLVNVTKNVLDKLIVDMRSNTNPSAPPAEPIPTGTPTTQTSSDSSDSDSIVLNQPFTLTIGQSMHIDQPTPLDVTLEAFEQESRCPKPSTPTVKVVCESVGYVSFQVGLRMGGEESTVSLALGLDVSDQRKTKLGDYELELINVLPHPTDRYSDIFPNEYQATFVLRSLVAPNVQSEAPPPSEPEISPANGGIGCPNLTQADASELLQESVQAEAVDTLLFTLGELKSTEVANFCGYVSLAYNPDSPSNAHGPTLVSPIAADHAVVVAKLNAREYIKLLPLAEIIRRASRKSSAAQDPTLLQALLWGNNSEGVIDYLYSLAQNEAKMHARRVGVLGIDSAWFWIELEEVNIALLLHKDENEMNVVAALLGKDVNEEKVLTTATRLAMQMQRRSDFVTQRNESNECEFLPHATAMYLLNQPLSASPDSAAGLCGYGGVATMLGELEALNLEELPYGVAAGVLHGDDAHDLLERLAATIHQDNPQSNEAAYAEVQKQLRSGDLIAAQHDLYELMDKQQWYWAGTQDNYTGLYVKTTDNADHIVIAIAKRPDGHLAFIIARLKRERLPRDTFAYIELRNPNWIHKVPAVSQ